MTGEHNGTKIVLASICCLSTPEQVCSTNSGIVQYLTGTLRIPERYGMTMNKDYGLKVAVYVQVRHEGMLNAMIAVSELSVLSVSSFLQKMKDAPRLFLENLYSVFTFKAKHSQHLVISKPFKSIFVGYAGFRSLRTREGGRVPVGRTFLSLKASMLWLFNSSLTFLGKCFLYLDCVMTFGKVKLHCR